MSRVLCSAQSGRSAIMGVKRRKYDAPAGEKKKDALEIHDLIVIGYGPAGVSLAVALKEKGWLASSDEGVVTPVPRLRFLEAGEQAGWHEQLMFDDAHINHHHFFDLATPLNPRSHFTFANYLYIKGRLFDFGLTKASPSRREWSDYIRWVGDYFSQHVSFNQRVARLEACFDTANNWYAIKVVCESGSELFTKRLILANGSMPQIPSVFRDLRSPKVFHASSYHKEMAHYSTDQFDGVVTVIGGGMSGGEIVLDLHARYPKSKIISLHRRQGFRTADLSGFSSSLYNPNQVDRFYNFKSDSKERFLSSVSNSNYGGLTDEGVQKLFNLMYLESIQGDSRLTTIPFADIQTAKMRQNRIALKGIDIYADVPVDFETDLVVLATGYDTNPMSGLLGDLDGLFLQDDTGMPAVSRHYAIEPVERSSVSIHLSGLCEFSHGISDSHSFNMLATRSQKILNDIANRHIRTMA